MKSNKETSKSEYPIQCHADEHRWRIDDSLGVFTKDLNCDRINGSRQMFVLMLGGAHKPHWNLPQLRESVVVVEGNLEVAGESFPPGSFLAGPADLANATTETGCVLLLTLTPSC